MQMDIITWKLLSSRNKTSKKSDAATVLADTGPKPPFRMLNCTDFLCFGRVVNSLKEFQPEKLV